MLCSDKAPGPELGLARLGLALFDEIEELLGEAAGIRRAAGVEALWINPKDFADREDFQRHAPRCRRPFGVVRRRVAAFAVVAAFVAPAGFDAGASRDAEAGFLGGAAFVAVAGLATAAGFATALTTASSPSLLCITGRPTHDA